MGNVQFNVSYAGFNAIRNSPGVQAELLGRANAIASRSGSMGCPCKADVLPGRTRAHARVQVTDVAARKNSKENTLLKSIDAGRSK